VLLEPGPPRAVDVKAIRQELGLTQAQLADLASVSLRTVQSCEQGWRHPSTGLERMVLLLLMAHRNGSSEADVACWEATVCPEELREECLAYRTRRGQLCWILTGRLYRGLRLPSWTEKRTMCERCLFFRHLMGGELPLLDRALPGPGCGGRCGRDVADE